MINEKELRENIAKEIEAIDHIKLNGLGMKILALEIIRKINE